jgi:hypothetical protein
MVFDRALGERPYVIDGCVGQIGALRVSAALSDHIAIGSLFPV